MFTRYYANLESMIEPGKVLVIYGPRRVGKTTLVQSYLASTKWKYKLDSGDSIQTQITLSSQDFSRILPYAEGYELLVIDEAQQIPNIGMALKILVDQRPDLRIVATGSSSFDLSNKIGEPLTGRKHTITMYPLAQMELRNAWNTYELKEKLSEFLLYGSYPAVLTSTNFQQKKELLDELVNAYLLKDILSLERVKGSKYLVDLLKLLALQIGQLVSYQELARQLGLSVTTVQRYIDLFEKTFIVTRLGGFSRNMRTEISRRSKYYFYDVGLRNALISQFSPLEDRNDVGALWENFLFIERLKRRAYNQEYAGAYFWRTYDGQEIDLLEESDGKLSAFEFKWLPKKAISAPSSWRKNYPLARFSIISQDNYLPFIGV